MTENLSALTPLEVRDRIVRPTLALLSLPGSLAAEKLVMGTAAQESRFKHVRQLPRGKGPRDERHVALGLWQMEPATFDDVWGRWLATDTPARRALRTAVVSLGGAAPTAQQMVTNHALACAMCRLLYRSRPFALHEDAAVEDLAAIWKRYYNTPAGAGTEAQFLANYRRLVAPLY